MRSRNALLVIAILLGAIVVTMLSIYNSDVPQDEPAITFKVGHKTPGFEVYEEVTMNFGGMHIGGISILAIIGSLIGYFAILFWMYVAWRVLRMLEKLSDTCNRLLQQKMSEGQD